MSTLQDVSEGFCASMDMDMDMDTEQTWQDWINIEACTPEVNTGLFGNEYQQPVKGLNYDYPEFIPCAQYAIDVCPAPAMDYHMSWNLFALTFQGLVKSSPVSPSSSLSSISISPPCSPDLSPRSTRNFDVDELTSVNTDDDAITPSPSLPPPPTPVSKSLRSGTGTRSSSRRAVHYGVLSLKTATPRRSLRPRGTQKYCELTPYLSGDDNDTCYMSDNDFDYSSQASRRRGASSLHSQTRILHQIQRDTSLTSCPICASNFSRHADVIRHYLSVHYIKSDAEILNDTSNKRLHCLGCTKILSRKDSRERHEAICPVYCAQRGIVPNAIRTIENARKRRACSLKTSLC